VNTSAFVAREQELTQLAQFLDRAMAGQGQVCFVMGDAGSGKTALVREFTRRAQEQHEDLLVAVGQGDAETGAGDAYLPFREVLGQLTGDVEADVARGTITKENASRLRSFLHLSLRALVEVGPDLIGIFVPGAGLAVQVGAFAAEKVGWLEKLERLIQRPRGAEAPTSAGLDQDHIFEQYTNVLRTLASKQPLLLVLDDLHWTDAASVGLLFRLGRRIEDSRVLIVGTYRPDEVAIGRAGERHPLEKVLAEFKRYYGETRVDLGQAREMEGQRFVDAFLDTEPNRLGKAFREALYEHTGGHPLFTIELLRDMQERGDVVRDTEGHWAEGPSLDWDTLPARVEGVIEERMGRLENELRETLIVASVEGEDFTAEVVAGAQDVPPRGLIRRLSGELDKQHHLVKAREIRRLGPGKRLSRYEFEHNLFQAYLYSSLDEIERVMLHEDVGSAMEALYGDQADEIAVELAWHFSEADMPEKAIPYLRRAGEQAAAQYANDVALSYLNRALELTPESERAERYALLRVRERVYDLQGMREAQQQDLVTLAELAEDLDDMQRRAYVALRQAVLAEVTGEYPAAISAAEMVIGLAQEVQDVATETTAHLCWGRALWQQGDCDAARPQLERALGLAQIAGLRQQEAASLHNLGIVSARFGDPVEAEARFEQAGSIYREIGDRQGQSSSSNALGIVAAGRGDFDRARGHFEQALAVYREIGDRRGEGTALGNVGQVCAERGDYGDARDAFEGALKICREIEDREGEGAMLTNLGVMSGEQGDHSASKEYFEQAVRILHEIGNRRVEGFALGGLGLVLLRLGDYTGAEEHLERGLGILHEINDPQGECLVLAYRGLLAHRLGDDEGARAFSEQSLRIAKEVGERATQAYALTHLGHALAKLGAGEEAANAYQRALALRRELGQPNLAMEPLAGLAHLALVERDLPQALSRVDEILDTIKTSTPAMGPGHGLDGTLEPFRVYVTCCNVLGAAQDPRTEAVLRDALQLLEEQAARIGDEELRHTFLSIEYAMALSEAAAESQRAR
jgi:adenylate cyclase